MRSLLLVNLSLVGCFYISPGHHADALDPDGDGVPFPDDCAPEDGSLTVEVELYADTDGDGYGDGASTVLACGPREGFVANPDDCDDTDGGVHPGADEVCDGEQDEDCDGQVDEAGALGEQAFPLDADGDGYGTDAVVWACSLPEGASVVDGDCDDADPHRNPGADEICSGVDDDCDQLIDEADPSLVGATTYYADADADAFGDADAPVVACAQPDDAVTNADDCDDTNDAVNPGAVELCDDAQVDENCNGLANESGTERPYYVDDDGDGYGVDGGSVEACAVPAGYSPNADDCDDTHSAINPGADEVCDAADVDEDCDGFADDADPGPVVGPTFYPDLDLDGFGDGSAEGLVFCDSVPVDLLADGSDCDDASELIHPDADEVCDSIDNDCDGLVDDDDDGVLGLDWYADADGDGYGAGPAVVQACEQPADTGPDDTDCDDSDADVSPGADEVCGGGDEDCDGLVDDEDDSVTGGSIAYLDLDGDGFGGVEVGYCGGTPPPHTVLDGGDCDDVDVTVYPGADEACDDVDRNCDGDLYAGATDTTPFYADDDHDGYGDALDEAFACTAPANRVADATDCDDADPSVNPGATEVCGGGDEDCNQLVDDADPGLGGDVPTWYADADGDGYGGALGTAACIQPAGTVTNNSDCDDTSAAISPDTPYYTDLDGDGYGDGLAGAACELPSGFAAVDGDCNDGVAEVNPGADELCDGGVDEDCDGAADDGDDDAIDRTELWTDGDGDGYGTGSGTLYCVPPAGDWVEAGGDCDDADPDFHPDHVEIARDGIDSDCDGLDEVCGNSIHIVPTYFPTVSNAVALTCDGDQVHIEPGTYVETGISVTTDILIRGTDNTNRAVLDAQGGGRMFVVDAEVEIRHIDFVDGDAANGGCIRQLGGSLDLDRVSFTGCNATVRGGAIWADDVTIDNATFTGNSAPEGGAIYVGSNSFLSVDDTTFVGNAAVDGGAVVCDEGIFNVTDTTFLDNVAGQFGGGVYAPGCFDIEVARVDFVSNDAGDLGGGMMVRYPDNLLGDSNIVDVAFIENTSVNEGGGLLILDTDTADLDLDEGLFVGNIAGGPGGGLYLENVYGTDLDDLVFEQNEAPDGAAIFAAGVNVDWDQTLVRENVAFVGAVVTVFDAVQDNRAIDGMRFEDNVAGDVMAAVFAAEPIDVMRMNFSGTPTGRANLYLEGPVSAHNVLSVGAGVELGPTTSGTTRLVNATIDGAVGAGVRVLTFSPAELTNVIVTSSGVGIENFGNAVLDYCVLADNIAMDYVGGDPGSTTTIGVSPGYVGGGDYHLAPTSGFIDLGSPALQDPDGTRSDPGYYGGPYAQ